MAMTDGYRFNFKLTLKYAMTEEQVDTWCDYESEDDMVIFEGDEDRSADSLIVWTDGIGDDDYIDCVLRYIDLALAAGCHPVSVKDLSLDLNPRSGEY